ncbi:MAG: hypothetical protein AB1327_08130 [Bacillota bacterium]
MDREGLFRKARRHGWEPGKGLSSTGRANLKRELIDYLAAPEGQKALGRSPSWLREKPLDEIAELLLSEVDAGG